MKRPSGSRRVGKSCPLTAPKPSAKNAVDSRVAKVGLPSSRTGVGINVRRAWRTIARGAAKPWEPSGPAVCKTSVAYLRKQSKLAHYFRPTAKILPTNGLRFGVRFCVLWLHFRVAHSALDFGLVSGSLGSGRRGVFYVRVFKNRLLACSDRGPKMTSQMAPFWHPLGAKTLFCGEPKNVREKVPQK